MIAKIKRRNYELGVVIWEKILYTQEVTSVTQLQVQIFRCFFEARVTSGNLDMARATFKVGTYMIRDQ